MIVGAMALAAVAAFACSSSSGNNSLANCLASANGASASCTSCVESKCGSQLSAANSACSAFVSCACPGGTYSASAAMSESCEMNATTSDCQTAGNNIDSCVTSNCASQCNSGTTSGSGSSSGSSTSSSSGSSTSSSSGSTSSGGTPTGSCASLATCCGMLPSGEQPSCNALAGENIQSACQEALGGFTDAGQCN
ncbi:MAG: hypothetical protein ABSE49_06975 [Polyangiaceae bacterium]